MGAEQSAPRNNAPGVASPAVQAFLRELRGPEFADDLDTSLPPPAGPELYEVPAGADLRALYGEAAAAAGIQVHPATAGDWVNVLAGVLQGLEARAVLVEPLAGSALTPERAAELDRALAVRGITTTRAHDDATLFERVDAAVTGVRLAVAETGTLICTSGAQSARGSSLIPPAHVAIVSAGQVVGDLFEAFARLGAEPLPANVNLITGPSKTADIEGVLVTGVHGPGRVHVVLIDE